MFLARGRSDVDRASGCWDIGRRGREVLGLQCARQASQSHAGGRRNEPRCALPPGDNRRVRAACRSGSRTLNRSLAMELRPLGVCFAPWCVEVNSGLPYRELNGRLRGARERASPAARQDLELTHGASSRAPLPQRRERRTASRTARAGPNDHLRVRARPSTDAHCVRCSG